jgi:hypothetical protein
LDCHAGRVVTALNPLEREATAVNPAGVGGCCPELELPPGMKWFPVKAITHARHITGHDEVKGANYGRRIAAPVVARLSSSVCAFAASFSA